MGLSVNKFTYAGNPDFDLNFAMGYLSKSDVTCVKTGTIPVNVEFDWLTPSKVRINTQDVELGDELKFFRTVSKTTLPVDLSQPGNATREALRVNSVYAAMLVHEVLDGRFKAYSEIDASVFEIVQAAVESAVVSSGLLVKQSTPVQFQYSGVPLAWPCENFREGTIKARLHIVERPSQQEEILVSGENGVLVAINVPTSGEPSFTYYPVESGELITVTSTTVHGAKVNLVVSGTSTDFLEFATEFPDFAEQYRSLVCR